MERRRELESLLRIKEEEMTTDVATTQHTHTQRKGKEKEKRSYCDM
jgi:hypothetical protein